MRRSVWLALAASLLHGKAAGLPVLYSSSAGCRAHSGGSERPAPGPGLGARARRDDGWRYPGLPGKGEPRSSGLLALGGRGHGQGEWGAPPLAFPEQPAGLSSP